MEWTRRRLLLLAALGAAMALTPRDASAQSAPHIVVIVAEGTGFPFEDPAFNRYPSLHALRLGSRAFDAVFTSDAAWTGLNEALLGGVKARGASRLVSALAAKRYLTSSVSASGFRNGGFDRALKAGIADTAARVLGALDTAGARPAFVFATMDLRSVPSVGPSWNVLAPPLTVPAIALSDRAPLDPVRFPVTPPPREPADRGGLAAARHAAFMALDREIGAIQTGVLKRGLASKTVIVLVSTGPAPRPERSAPPRPDLLFEDWLRGLVLIRTPTIAQPGVAAATLGRFEDVALTLAALGGATLARGGALDLGPAIRDPKVLLRQTLLTGAARDAPKVGRSVRSQLFRFTQWPDGSEELFDEAADPNEWTNLAKAPGMQGQRAGLLRRLVLPPPPGKATPARPSAGRRPNVLMIIGDDLTAQYAQFGDVKTPNLDRLRARGRFYEKAYAPAPFCTPSRAAFLSGMSPARLELHRENVFAEIFTPQVPLMQEQFRANGYYTASVGKVWDSQPGEKRGWDLNEWLPDLLPGQVEKRARLIENMPVEGGPTDNADEVEGDGRRTRLAVKVLETKRDQPLFLALGLVRPHAAWIAPRKYFDLYPLNKIRFTKAPANDGIDIPGIAIRNRPQSLPGLMMAGREPAGLSDDETMAKRGIAAYLACVSFMDAQLGLVLDAMDRQDLWNDTIVVFFGDNGHHFGDHGGLWRKNTLFEESLRVPMIIASPGQAQPGVSTNALADLIDIYPTLVDLTGIAKPGTLDGVSLVPTLADPRASVQDALIQYRPAEPPRQGYTLRTARHRYTLWPDGSEELYDLAVDPAGRHDLASQPAQAATLRTLRTQIEGLVK
jgi:uncharacterized sulfatase